MYLVTFDTTMDNIPMRLFDHEADAMEFIATIPAELTTELLELNGAGADPCCISMWIFEDGKCVQRLVVRKFDDEEEDE